MHRWLLALILVGLCSVLAVSAGAARAQATRFAPPPLRGYVVDETHTLSPAETQALDRRLEAFHRQHGYAVAALVLPSLEGMTIEDVAYETFNTWQLGDEGKDNGVLLVIAPAERRTRIETGKGVGGELTDLESAEILQSRVGPALAAGDLKRAIEEGTSAIEQALTGDLPVGGGEVPPPTGEPRAPPMSPRSLLVMAVLIALAGVLAVVSPGFRMVLFALLWSVLRGGGLGRGGGSGGGPGGGGRSGGGGASGSY